MHIAAIVGGAVKRVASGKYRLTAAFAGAACQVQQTFDFGVLGDDVAILPYMDEIKRVQAVVLGIMLYMCFAVQMGVQLAIPKRKDNARSQAFVSICWYNSVQAIG